jgi:hypothetical protein
MELFAELMMMVKGGGVMQVVEPMMKNFSTESV